MNTDDLKFIGGAAFLVLLCVGILGYAAVRLQEPQRDRYAAACVQAGGTPAFNGKFYECLGRQ